MGREGEWPRRDGTATKGIKDDWGKWPLKGKEGWYNG